MINKNKILKPAEGQERRLVFFAGKGGVGKTVASAASAFWLAEQGHRTLLVTTDPADHLSEVFGIQVDSEPRPLPGEENLLIARVDQKKATEKYKERVLSEARQNHDEQMLQAIKEELNSPCTEEMAAFEKFISFVEDDSYDVTVFDTAPTGHTLRLLELPMDYDKQAELMVTSTMDDDDQQEAGKYSDVISRLRDPEETSFIFVVYPENTPIMEAHRASEDLEEAGIKTAMVIANQVLLKKYCTTEFFEKRYDLQQKHLNRLEELFDSPVLTLPLLDEEIQGKEVLRRAGKMLWETEQVIEEAEV